MVNNDMFKFSDCCHACRNTLQYVPVFCPELFTLQQNSSVLIDGVTPFFPGGAAMVRQVAGDTIQGHVGRQSSLTVWLRCVGIPGRCARGAVFGWHGTKGLMVWRTLGIFQGRGKRFRIVSGRSTTLVAATWFRRSREEVSGS